MSDDARKKMPDGVVPLDIGCFRQLTPEEMLQKQLRYFGAKTLEEAYWRIMRMEIPKPAAEQEDDGKASL